MTVRVLAIADADSYLKWAAATLSQLDERFSTDVVVLRNPVEPSAAQVKAALAGTPLAGRAVPSVSLARLRGLLRSERPDVVLVAATGPRVRLVVWTIAAAGLRPAIVTGLPGMALPATDIGVGHRSATDAFIVHSHRERREYRAAFARAGLAPRLPVTHLPFATGARTVDSETTDVQRIVFAAQAKVPYTLADRLRVLEALARAGEHREVIVKLRARKGERQTHNERYPYDELWQQYRAKRRWPDTVRFAGGPLADWLTPGTGLVTVSSTAALEAVAAGVPVGIIDDFGVDEEQLNEVFTGSGLLRHLADLGTGALGAPDPVWWRDNYGHTEPDEVKDCLHELGSLARAGELPPVAAGSRGVRAVLSPATLRLLLPGPRPEAVQARQAATTRRLLEAAAPPWAELDGRRCAYVTLVTGDDHHLARALANSLRRVTKVPLVAMCTPEADAAALLRSGIHVVDVPVLPDGRLNLLQLTSWDRLVHLDRASLVLQNLDDLFDPATPATPESETVPGSPPVLALAPDQALFDSIADGSIEATALTEFLDAWQVSPTGPDPRSAAVVPLPDDMPDPVWLEHLERWELYELIADLRGSSREPTVPELRQLARAHREAGRYDESLALLRRARALQPGSRAIAREARNAAIRRAYLRSALVAALVRRLPKCERLDAKLR